jgi:hypothetical protein
MVCPEPTKPVELEYHEIIRVKYDEHLKIKWHLDACGVNYWTMFPDLKGIAEQIGWMYKWNQLKRFQ